MFFCYLCGMKVIEPIAIFRSPFTTKFGIPRQSGIVEGLRGRVVFQPDYAREEALRGLASFDYVWLIWGFSANEPKTKSPDRQQVSLTVRPPRLGGNERLGVFATRSPFRPNGLGLSCVRVLQIGEGVIEVEGADLMNGTPIYDIKPYIPYTDSHPDARGGFTDQREWKKLEVHFPETLSALFPPDEQQVLTEILSQDPRPRYHDDAERVYGMPFNGYDIRFQVSRGIVEVVEVRKC